jgi:hypothetical protein
MMARAAASAVIEAIYADARIMLERPLPTDYPCEIAARRAGFFCAAVL